MFFELRKINPNIVQRMAFAGGLHDGQCIGRVLFKCLPHALALRGLGHQVEEREETFSTSFFGRPNAVMVQPGTGRLLGGVNQYKPTLAMGL
jgi:hypothetical protein